MQKPNLIWLNILVFSITGIITIIGVPLYAINQGIDGWIIFMMLFAIGLSEISITAGYHRLWTHKAYEAHWLVRSMLAIGGTFAMQNSILHWASDHRRHHRYVDDHDKDPYSASRGFWFSHIGWMLREHNADIGDYSNCKDLQRDPIVMWQHRHYGLSVVMLNVGIPMMLGWWYGDFWGVMLMVGVVRLVISHHFTFFINSLSHIWGSQPYSDQNSSKDNSFLSVLTMGEGYHNYHHKFQNDFRNGILWWQFDPTKWLISSMAMVGLAYKLKRTPVERIESSRALMLLKKTTNKLVHLPHAEELMQKLHTEYDILIHKIDEFAEAKKQWLKANKATLLESCDFDALKEQVETLKSSFKQQKKIWLALNAQMLIEGS